jgi:flavin reductase (DIM6/NTAB) family NADH-FMN oxidoreductase RutF
MRDGARATGMRAPTVDATSFRGLMSRWAAGVSLITCQTAEKPVGPCLLEHGTIVLQGCIATLVCTFVDEFIHGDHAVIVGEVVHGEGRDGDELIFFRGDFATLRADDVRTARATR